MLRPRVNALTALPVTAKRIGLGIAYVIFVIVVALLALVSLPLWLPGVGFYKVGRAIDNKGWWNI